MKKLNISIYIIMTIVLFGTTSCHDGDTNPKGEFEKGVFIINEGNFNDADGSITYYSPANGAVQQDIFGIKNNGKALGDVVQSMTVDGDLAYIAVNNDNKIEVVNVNTFVSAYTLEGLKLPRYVSIIAGKGYFTEWVSYTDSGRVSIINLINHTVESSIKTDYGAENLIAINGKLFVSNNFTNTVSVIDLTLKKVIQTINVASSPGMFEVDRNNKLWVLCGGGSDVDYKPLNNGALCQINTATFAVEKTIELNMNVIAKLAIDRNKEHLYFMKDKSVYKLDISDTSVQTDPIISENAVVDFYGIGVDPSTDILYVGDAKAFNGSGTVYRYKNDGTLIDHFIAGRGPNGFVFR